MALVELKNEETTTAGDHIYNFDDPELVGKLDALAKAGKEESRQHPKWRLQWKRRVGRGWRWGRWRGWLRPPLL